MNTTTKVGIAGTLVAAVVAAVAISLPSGELGEMDKALRLVDASVPTAVAANATPTVTAIKSGNWSDPTVWSTGALPVTDDKVLIPAGLSVQQDVDTSRLKWLYVQGTFGPRGPPCTLWCETVVTGMSSTLAVGTPAVPFSGQWNIKFADYGALDTTADPWAVGRGLITCGQCAIYGQPKDVRAFLAADALIGQTTLTLAAAPVNWNAGDPLVVPGINPNANEDDECTIQAISGTTVTIAAPLKFNHPLTFPCCGTAQKTYMLAANYAPRSVHCYSENPALGHRGHVMVMRPDLTTPLVWHNLSIQDCGRTDKSVVLTDPDGAGNGLANPRGRYAWHAHRCNPLITGVMGDVYGLVVVGSPGWGPTNHDSYFGITSSLAYKIFGSHFVSETPTGTGYFADNTAIRSTQPNNSLNGSDNRGVADYGHDGTGFWNQNSFVMFEGINVAFGMANTGFMTIPGFILPGKPDMLCDPRNLPPQYATVAATLPATGFDSVLNPQHVSGVHAIGCQAGHRFWAQEGNPINPAPIDRCSLSNCVGLVAENGEFSGYMSQINFSNLAYTNPSGKFTGHGFANSGFQGWVTYNNVLCDGFEVGIEAPINGDNQINSATLRCLVGIHIPNVQVVPPRTIAIKTPTFQTISPAELENVNRSPNTGSVLFYVNGFQQKNIHMRLDALGASIYGQDPPHILRFCQGDDQFITQDTTTLDGRILHYPETADSFALSNLVGPLYQYVGAGGGGTLPIFAIGLTNGQMRTQHGLTLGNVILPSDAQPLAGSVALIGDLPRTVLPTIRASSTYPAANYQVTNSPVNYPLWVQDGPGNFFFAGTYNLTDKADNACTFQFQGQLRGVSVHCDSTLVNPPKAWPQGTPSNPNPPPPPPPPPPTTVTVPDVATGINTAIDAANTTLQKAGLTGGAKHVSQSPAAGTQASPGSAVTVQ